MDGKITSNEWAGAEFHRIEMTGGIELNFSIIYTTTMVYYLAVIDHSREVDTIQLNPTGPHDYFGLEFDNNNDEAIMGTARSPDDTIIVNYEENTAADMFMHSYKAFYDINNGGIDNTQGRAGSDGKRLIFEFSKPLQSTDSAGHDFNLVNGQKYQIMLAFWDNAPTGTASAFINTRVDNNQFLTLTVGATQSNTSGEIIATLMILISLLLSYPVVTFGMSSSIEKLKQYLSKN